MIFSVLHTTLEEIKKMLRIKATCRIVKLVLLTVITCLIKLAHYSDNTGISVVMSEYNCVVNISYYKHSSLANKYIQPYFVIDDKFLNCLYTRTEVLYILNKNSQPKYVPKPNG